MIVLYNVVFILPLLAIVGVAAVAGGGDLNGLRRLFDALVPRIPVLLPVGIGCIGAALTVAGAVGV